MQLRVLGCAGAEFPGHHPTAFLIDNELLLDAGTIGAVLKENEQWRIRNILITHAHLDHIQGIPLLADNVIVKGLANRITLFGTGETIKAVRSHLLNGVIWPDFTVIPSPESPVLSCMEIIPEQEFAIGEYKITAFQVNHAVPAVGFRITKGAAIFLYTGDTGPTDRIWEMAGGISALLVEVSFPNAMDETAFLTGHLTPLLLGKELAKLTTLPRRIFVTHMKPQYQDTIKSELEALGIVGLELLHDGGRFEL